MPTKRVLLAILAASAAMLVVGIGLRLPVAGSAAGMVSHGESGLIQTSVTLTPVADASITAAEPDTPHGNDHTLEVYYGGENEIGRALIRFNLAAAVPSDAIIDEARLDLYLEYGDGADPVNLVAANLTEDWVESEVTWNTPPAMGEPTVATLVDTTLGYTSLDVTDIVQAWHNVPHYGLELSGREGGANYSRIFESREHGENPPQLVVTYHLSPTPTNTPTPTAMPTSTPTPPPPSTADLLIIAPEAFTPPLRALAAHKNDTSMPTRMLTIEEIEASYSGYDLPERIKKAIEAEHRLHEVKYVMLVGDTDIFPVRWAYICIPTSPLSCAKGFPWRFSGAYGSADLYYADLYESNGTTFEGWDFDGDHKYGETGCNWCTGANADNLDLHMDVVVGRVPVSSLQEVTTYVNKVIRYEYMAGYGGGWTHQALVVAGNSGNSRGAANKIAAKAPSLQTTVLAYDAPGCVSSTLPTRDNINTRLNEGALLAVYLGHGSGPKIWGIGQLCDGTNSSYNVPNEINAADGPDNAYMLPVVLDFACENGQYGPPVPWHFPYLDVQGQERDYGCNPPCFTTPLEPEEPASLQVGNDFNSQPFDRESTAEWFLVRSDDGAIAEIASYGFGDSGNWRMGETFFQTYQNGQHILGELWKATLEDFIGAGDPDNQWHFRHLKSYHLFGDPSLRVGGVSGLKGMPPVVDVSEAVADASIYDNHPGNNYGNYSDIGFMNYPGDYKSRALVRFDVSGIPLSATISLADMNLYVLTAGPASGWNKLYELQNTWVETSVTWNNAPGWGTQVFNGTITPTQWTYFPWSVVSSVNRWANHGVTNNGWLLRGNEDNQYIYSFAAREHSNYPHPQLVVKYQPPCPAKLLLGLVSHLSAQQSGLDTLYRLRDELMTTTPRGRHFIDLFYEHSPELATLLLTHSDLREEGTGLLEMLLPGLEALVNGEGDTVAVTPDMVERLDAFLARLNELASPDLQDDIAQEWERANPSTLVEQTFAGAWEQVAGQWAVYLPLIFSPPGTPPQPEHLEFSGQVFLGEAGDTSQPLGGVDAVVLLGATGRFGPSVVLDTTQAAEDGSFFLGYEYTIATAYPYYSLAISDTRYMVTGVMPGEGGEPWEPGWIQFVAPSAGWYLENAFFVQPVKQ